MYKKTQLYQEYPEHNEEILIEKICASIKERQTQQLNNNESVRRGFNAKQFGGFSGHLAVDDISKEYQVGFLRDKNTYNAVIRYGGGNPNILSDVKKADPNCISIKLLNVQGKKIIDDPFGLNSQDIVLFSLDTFQADSLAHFYNITQAALTQKKIKVLLQFSNPFAGSRMFQRWRTFYQNNHICGQKNNPDLSTITYWSSTPYKFGDKAVKYKLVPRLTGNNISTPLEINNFDLLKKNIITHLEKMDVVYDFCIQLQKDPYKMPIEDPTVKWSEKLSPSIKLATLTLPKQNFNKDLNSCIYQLSFNPWHSLKENKPLGAINRARMAAYQRSFQFRHQQCLLNKEKINSLINEQFQ